MGSYKVFFPPANHPCFFPELALPLVALSASLASSRMNALGLERGSLLGPVRERMLVDLKWLAECLNGLRCPQQCCNRQSVVEPFLLDRRGNIVYLGRFDDQYVDFGGSGGNRPAEIW